MLPTLAILILIQPYFNLIIQPNPSLKRCFLNLVKVPNSKQETASHDVASMHPRHLRLKGVVSEAGMGAHWHQLLSKIQVLKHSTNGHRGVMVDAVIIVTPSVFFPGLTQYLPTLS